MTVWCLFLSLACFRSRTVPKKWSRVWHSKCSVSLIWEFVRSAASWPYFIWICILATSLGWFLLTFKIEKHCSGPESDADMLRWPGVLGLLTISQAMQMLLILEYLIFSTSPWQPKELAITTTTCSASAYLLWIPVSKVKRKPIWRDVNSKKLASTHITEEFRSLTHLPGTLIHKLR